MPCTVSVIDQPSAGGLQYATGSARCAPSLAKIPALPPRGEARDVIGGRSAGAYGYDVFLSHSHVDKDWTRALYDQLARTDYNGRTLRPWLDQEVLDPGKLASSRELESALDRSRFLALALSPEAPPPGSQHLGLGEDAGEDEARVLADALGQATRAGH